MADETLAEQVLRAVELVPRGTVVSYGDIATIVGIGPRHVGNVLANHASGLPWWRVTNSRGELPAPLLARALHHWEDEGIQLKPDGLGCRIHSHRPDLHELAERWALSVADILEDPTIHA